MRKLLLSCTALAALSVPASADNIDLFAVTASTSQLSLSATVPNGNQPQNAPCLICGENQPQQPDGFGYNDFKNTGNNGTVTAFSDNSTGGRVTLADNTFNNLNGGYQVGDGSLFKLFLLSHLGDANNLTFNVGVDVNDTNKAQLLNAFFFLNLTQHTVLASYICTSNCEVPSFHNGTGYPDYTLTGFDLNRGDIALGDTVIFAARMSGLNDGPDSFFLEPGVAAVPGPIVGAGIPGLITACLTLLGLGRYRRKQTEV